MPAETDLIAPLFPGAPKESLEAFVRLFSGSGRPSEVDDLRAEAEDSRELLGLARDESARLLSELVRQQEGYENASRGGLDVLAERARSRRMEGYDDAHDAGRADFDLTAAAIAYLVDARSRGTTGSGYDGRPPAEWPWIPSDWKPKEVRQALVVAAALIVSEIERIDQRSGGRRGA